MLAAIVLMLLALQNAVADFHIGFSLSLYSNPNNTLADGSCCEDTCSSCNTVLFFCFRDSLHPHEDTDRSTCFLERERDNTAMFTFFPDNTPQIPVTFTGSLQLFVIVIHVSDIASFQQGLSGVEVELIDNVFLEFSDLTALPFDLVSFVETVFLEEMGDFGRVAIRAGVNVICAQGFNGSDCSTFCTEDSNGNLVCEQVEYSVPQSSTTTTQEEDDSTSGDDDSTMIIIISVVVSIGVAIFAVIMLVGLILGFRYLFRELQRYDNSLGFKSKSIKLEEKPIVRNTEDIDSRDQTVKVTVNVVV